MRLVSFDAYQAINIPGVRVIKPENWFREKAVIESADWVLFPEYWQVNPLVYGLKKRIFPSVSSYHIGHDKVEMARAFEAVCPLNCPNTRILANTERSMEQILDEYDFPFVAKTIRSARGEGVFLIGDRADFRKYAEKNEVLFIQEYLPIYRDLRVIVIGRQIVTAYWRQAREGCFHNNISRGGEVSFENIPDSALQLVNHVAETLGINYAGLTWPR